MVKNVIKEFIKFCITGVIGAVVHIGFLYIFTEYLLLYYVLSSFFAFILANITTYVINKTWTFKEKFRDRTIRKYPIFLIISTVALAVNLSLLYAFTEYLGIYYIFSQALATLFSLWINFIGNKLWTFRKH